MRKVVTVDGPSGVGKGTLCQRLARDLGWAYLDSGALYRLAALEMAKRQLQDAPADVQAQALAHMPFRFVPHSSGIDIFLGDEAVNHKLRLESTGEAASRLAAKPEIRAALLDVQRRFAGDKPLIADGRDMGTVVFPEAPAKFFLTASPQVRAERRYKQLLAQGECVNLPALSNEIAARDARDSSRLVAPLKPASDAVIIDTGTLSIDEVATRVKQDLAVLFNF